MKALIILLLAIAILPSALALDAELRNLKGTCLDDGNAEISMVHIGGAIKKSEIRVAAVNIESEFEVKFEGKWIQENDNSPVYITGDYSKVKFITENAPFKEKGAYQAFFFFYPKQADYSETRVSVILECPGIQCSSDSDCNYNAACRNNVCTALRCKASEFIEFHSCNAKCNDRDSCTIDRYNPEDGSCSYIRNESCCKTDIDCNDGLACLTDKCVSGTCVHEPVKCEAAKDRCVTSTCIEPRGCIYQTEESCLVAENEKREYLIVIGEPKVYRQPFFSKLFGSIGNFFKNLF